MGIVRYAVQEGQKFQASPGYPTRSFSYIIYTYICTISHLYSHKVLDRKRKINFTIALLHFSLKMGHLALSSKTWSKRKGISQHGNSNEKDVMSLRTEFFKAPAEQTSKSLCKIGGLQIDRWCENLKYRSKGCLPRLSD